MRIIDRYIASLLLKTTFIALLVIVALFAFLSIIDQLEATGRGDYDTFKALQYVMLTIPRLAYELLPIAAVIGGIVCFMLRRSTTTHTAKCAIFHQALAKQASEQADCLAYLTTDRLDNNT